MLQQKFNKNTLSINDIKYDLLKVAEIYDGLLHEGTGQLAADMFSKYLNDMKEMEGIYEYEITDVVLKEQSYTYDISIQVAEDRTPKKLKIHVGLYKSPWPDVYSKMKYTGSGYVIA